MIHLLVVKFRYHVSIRMDTLGWDIFLEKTRHRYRYATRFRLTKKAMSRHRHIDIDTKICQYIYSWQRFVRSYSCKQGTEFNNNLFLSVITWIDQNIPILMEFNIEHCTACVILWWLLHSTLSWSMCLPYSILAA